MRIVVNRQTHKQNTSTVTLAVHAHQALIIIESMASPQLLPAYDTTQRCSFALYKYSIYTAFLSVPSGLEVTCLPIFWSVSHTQGCHTTICAVTTLLNVRPLHRSGKAIGSTRSTIARGI